MDVLKQRFINLSQYKHMLIDVGIAKFAWHDCAAANRRTGDIQQNVVGKDVASTLVVKAIIKVCDILKPQSVVINILRAYQHCSVRFINCSSPWRSAARSDFGTKNPETHPLPALRNLERNLIVDADRLAVAALLIVRPIGTENGIKMTALRVSNPEGGLE